MLYGIGQVDASGRVADHRIIKALGWQQGRELTVTVASRVIIIQASAGGIHRTPRKPCIVIPATARHQCDIAVGDLVLLAAAPRYGFVVVHTLAALDDMLAQYHAQSLRQLP